MEILPMIMMNLVSALIYAHKKKIYHGDLKPLNIFWFDKDLFKIGDWGAS